MAAASVPTPSPAAPSWTSSAARGRTQRVDALPQRDRLRKPALPLPHDRERLERRQPIGRLRQRPARGAARPAASPCRARSAARGRCRTSREPGAIAAALSNAARARVRRARAPSAPSRGAAPRRGCARSARQDAARRAGSPCAYSPRTKRPDARSITSKSAAHVDGPRRVLADDGRRARSDVAEARELAALVLVERFDRGAAPRSTAADSRGAPCAAAREGGALAPRSCASRGSATTS